MHKTLAGIVIVLLSTLLLAGCTEQKEEPASEAATEETASQENVVAVEELEPLSVAISTGASILPDRRLSVEGETNLPDGTRVQVIVEREASSVRWHARTSINQGGFEAGPFGSGSGLPDGGYIVRVQSSEASVQPASVQARIGSHGEHLSGDLVSQSRHGLGKIATYSRRFLIGSETRRTRDQVDIVEDVGR